MAKDIRQAAVELARRAAREQASGSFGRVFGVNYKTHFTQERLREIERRQAELAEQLRLAEEEARRDRNRVAAG